MITAPATRDTGLAGLEELYRELHSFGLELREAALKFQDLAASGAFQERGKTFQYKAGDPHHAINRSIDITRNFEFMVAMTGAFSSGKSTLLNLLLDDADLLPSSVIPLTAVCTVIRYGEESRFRVRYVTFEQALERVPMCVGKPFKKPFSTREHIFEAIDDPTRFVDGDAARESLVRFCEVLRRYDEIVEMPASFAEREPFIAGGGIVPDASEPSGFRYYAPTPKEEEAFLRDGGDPRRWVTREWLAMVRDVTLWVPSPLLANNIVFLDLPGLNCKEDYHRRAIQEYCNMADCILVTAFQPGNQADEEILHNFKRLSANFHEKIFFAFNKVDQFATEPQELVRAVDYLARDTIGSDFPQERFFLTSGQLAKAHRTGDRQLGSDLDRLSGALSKVSGEMAGLGGWIDQLTDADDPGGVGHLKQGLFQFLADDAYQTKIAEIVRNYHSALDALVAAAAPTYEESLHMDPTDMLRKSVLDFYRYTEKVQRKAMYHFRYDYLRGNGGKRILKDDLKKILERLHSQVQTRIRAYFDQPILSTPLREDPVSEFDLQMIADEASSKLRRELQELVTSSVHDRVRAVFRDFLHSCEFYDHAENLFSGAPDCARRLEALLAQFEETMLHSLKVIVRNGFFYMPRGRELKRLSRTVPLSELKDLLIEVFCDFYPSWIYENIYGEIIDRLWLSLFLDSEDVEQELAQFFESAEGVITGPAAAEHVKVPQKLVTGSRNVYRTVRMCQEIDLLLRRRDELERDASRVGVTS